MSSNRQHTHTSLHPHQTLSAPATGLQSSANLYQPNAFAVDTANQQSTERPIQDASRSQAQDDFYLLDVIGGQNVSVLHPTKPIVAYTAGCMVIVYDMISDAKIQLVNHQHEVKALAFSVVGSGGSSAGGDHLISIDSNRNDAENTAKLCLWNWARGVCIQEVSLPQSQVSNTLLETSSFIVQFDRTGTLFTVIQSTNTAYRASIWSFSRHSSIDLIAHTDLDHQAGCTSAAILKTKSAGGSLQQITSVYLNQSLSFLTLEKNCVKLWEFCHGSFELQKRIHIKQAISQVVVSDLTGFLVILGDNGKVLILDQAGNFVSTVFKAGVFFTSVSVANDKLLLGTEKGAILVYHMASLCYISEIPYQFSLLPDQILNHSVDTSPQQSRNGPPTRQIELTNNLRFIKIQYADSSFVVVDRTQTSPKDAIIGHHFGHFDSIADIEWMGQHPSREIDSHEQHQYSLVYQSSECFMTCSSDLSVFVWRHHGDRWQFNYIDVAKCFDESLSFQRKGCDRSTAELQLTAMCCYPRRRQNILIGDNKGMLRVFQLGKDVATYLASFTIAPNAKICKLFISENESVAVVTFESGKISLYDVKSSFSWLGNVETGSGQSTHSHSLVVEKKVNQVHSDVYATLQSQQVGTSFKVFSMTAPNCIRAQLVDVKDARMTKSQLGQYFIAEGKITGFDLHPSKDYILITSNRAKVYLYRIETGELRGTISIPLHAQGCLVDPAGLYVVVQVPPFSANLLSGATTVDLMGSNERGLKRTTVLMYEIGTGQAAAEILSVFDISQMKFSNDGRYLTLGSRQGSVSVWAIGDHLYQNMRQILEAMAQSNDFWYNYPIFLSDHQVVPQPPKLPSIDSKQFSVEQENKKATNVPNPYLNYLPTGAQHHQMNKVPYAEQEPQVYCETPIRPVSTEKPLNSPQTRQPAQSAAATKPQPYSIHKDQIEAKSNVSVAYQNNQNRAQQLCNAIDFELQNHKVVNSTFANENRTAVNVGSSLSGAYKGPIEDNKAQNGVQRTRTDQIMGSKATQPFELYQQAPQLYVERILNQPVSGLATEPVLDFKREPTAWSPAIPASVTTQLNQPADLHFLDRSLNDRAEVTIQQPFSHVPQQVLQVQPAEKAALAEPTYGPSHAGTLYQNQEFIQRLAPQLNPLLAQQQRLPFTTSINPEPADIDAGVEAMPCKSNLDPLTCVECQEGEQQPQKLTITSELNKRRDEFLEDSDAISSSFSQDRVEEAYNAIEDFEKRRKRQQQVVMFGAAANRVSRIYGKQQVQPSLL